MFGLANDGSDEMTRATYLIYELIFTAQIIKNFLQEYVPEGEVIPIRSLSKISNRYLNSNFLRDFIPTFPITFIVDTGPDSPWRIFFLIKIMRLAVGLKIYKIQNIMKYIQGKFRDRLLLKIEVDPRIDDNIMVDNNSIDILMNIRYALETFKLILVIINVSYFTGIAWMIFCSFMEKWYQGQGVQDYNNFIKNYDIESFPQSKQMLISMYYSFTSLSTVGFGDFYAQDNCERLVCAVILLFGVAIFSYIMGKFVEMIDRYKILNADLEEGDELAKFLGMLQKFNNGKELDQKFKNKIEAFFDYRWKFDKNQSIDDE